MSFGSRYRFHEVGLRDVMKLAAAMRLSVDATIERFRDIARRTPDMAATTAAAIRGEGLDAAILDDLVDKIADHARACERKLEPLNR